MRLNGVVIRGITAVAFGLAGCGEDAADAKTGYDENERGVSVTEINSRVSALDLGRPVCRPNGSLIWNKTLNENLETNLFWFRLFERLDTRGDGSLTYFTDVVHSDTNFKEVVVGPRLACPDKASCIAQGRQRQAQYAESWKSRQGRDCRTKADARDDDGNGGGHP